MYLSKILLSHAIFNPDNSLDIPRRKTAFRIQVSVQHVFVHSKSENEDVKEPHDWFELFMF